MELNYNVRTSFPNVVVHILCTHFHSYDELVVGAPMFTTLSPLMPERGRVYIFFNTRVCVQYVRTYKIHIVHIYTYVIS